MLETVFFCKMVLKILYGCPKQTDKHFIFLNMFYIRVYFLLISGGRVPCGGEYASKIEKENGFENGFRPCI